MAHDDPSLPQPFEHREITVHPDQMSLLDELLVATPTHDTAPAPALETEPAPGPEPVSEVERGAWRVVALSDLHLDTPFAWAPPAVGRLRRQDLRDVLVATVELAATVGADALVLAGDIYEHDRLNPDTAAFVERILNASRVPVLVTPGNHDWLGPSSLWATASWADHVHIFDGASLEPFALAPGFTIWGAAHHRPAGTPGFIDNATISGDGIHLGVFHGSELSGFQVEGRDESGRSKQPHAPFEAHQIPNVGLDHAIVGHFHRRREGAHHTYPGNPAPLAFGEPGDGGAVVLDFSPDGRVTRTWHLVSQRPMADIDVDVTGCSDASAVVAEVRERSVGARGLVRLTLTGELLPGVAIHDDDILAAVPRQADHAVVRRKKLFIGYDLEAVQREASVRGQFVRSVLADDQLDEDLRRDVISTGLRALDGRADLDVAR